MLNDAFQTGTISSLREEKLHDGRRSISSKRDCLLYR